MRETTSNRWDALHQLSAEPINTWVPAMGRFELGGDEYVGTLIPLVHMLVRGVQLGEALYERGAQAAPSSGYLLQRRLPDRRSVATWRAQCRSTRLRDHM